MSNITLYYAAGTCSVAPHAIIHHLNIKDIKLISVDLRSHTTQDGDDFYKINPKGNVPTLIVNEHFKLNEGTAIVQYLADNYAGEDLIGKVGENRRYHILNFLNFLSSDLHKSFGILFKPNLKEDFVVDVAIPIIKDKLSYIENELKPNEFLVDNRLSVADFYLFALTGIIKRFLTQRLESLGVKIQDYTNLVRHYEKLSELPAIRKTLEIEGLKE